MSLTLLLLDPHSAPMGGGVAAPSVSFTPAIHVRYGVTQADVPGIAGPGLAMWGWMRGLNFGR